MIDPPGKRQGRSNRGLSIERERETGDTKRRQIIGTKDTPRREQNRKYIAPSMERLGRLTRDLGVGGAWGTKIHHGRGRVGWTVDIKKRQGRGPGDLPGMRKGRRDKTHSLKDARQGNEGPSKEKNKEH